MKSAFAAAVPLAVALVGSAVAPPSDNPVRVSRAAHVTLRTASNLSAADQALAEENCPLGLPQKDSAWGHGPTAMVARRGYALEESSVDKIPIWVCEHVEKGELQGKADRRDKFLPDPKLMAGKRSELSDYQGSGFDRGHMAPSADQKQSQTLNDETFYLSNMSPQVGMGFNRGIWAHLEGLTRDWVSKGAVATEYIITGPVFFDPKEEQPGNADGVIEHDVIGKNAVAVPTHFYKIVVGKTGNGQFKAVAFVLPNKKHTGPEDFSTFVRSVKWIETHTGLNFMPKAEKALEDQLELEPGQLFQ